MACKCNCISPEIDLRQNKLHALPSTHTLKMETTSIFVQNRDKKQKQSLEHIHIPPCLVACRARSPSGSAYAAPLDAKKPSKLDLKVTTIKSFQ